MVGWPERAAGSRDCAPARFSAAGALQVLTGSRMQLGRTLSRVDARHRTGKSTKSSSADLQSDGQAWNRVPLPPKSEPRHGLDAIWQGGWYDDFIQGPD